MRIKAMSVLTDLPPVQLESLDLCRSEASFCPSSAVVRLEPQRTDDLNKPCPVKNHTEIRARMSGLVAVGMAQPEVFARIRALAFVCATIGTAKPAVPSSKKADQHDSVCYLVGVRSTSTNRKELTARQESREPTPADSFWIKLMAKNRSWLLALFSTVRV